MSNIRFPPGWNEERVYGVLQHYESQSVEEQFAEDEATFADQPETVISIPIELMPAVRELLGKHQPSAT